MNKELEVIVNNCETQLQGLKRTSNQQLISLSQEVKNLQAELLNASLISKPKLEAAIKEKLHSKEIELYKLTSDKSQLELAYLYEYIREHYE